MNPKLPELPLKVLILEDCEEDMFFLLRKLESSGYQPDFERVWTEAATREALERTAWDLIISDSSLPGFDGLRALAMVKEMGLNIPFILLSGWIPLERDTAARKAGAFDCIPKNNLDLLVPAIERALQATKESTRGQGKSFPPVGEPVIAQCRDFRCLAYIDPDGKWWDYNNSKELPEVIDWFAV
jgi:DNA-binding NtrC family response regulator